MVRATQPLVEQIPRHGPITMQDLLLTGAAVGRARIGWRAAPARTPPHALQPAHPPKATPPPLAARGALRGARRNPHLVVLRRGGPRRRRPATPPTPLAPQPTDRAAPRESGCATGRRRGWSRGLPRPHHPALRPLRVAQAALAASWRLLCRRPLPPHTRWAGVSAAGVCSPPPPPGQRLHPAPALPTVGHSGSGPVALPSPPPPHHERIVGWGWAVAGSSSGRGRRRWCARPLVLAGGYAPPTPPAPRPALFPARSPRPGRRTRLRHGRICAERLWGGGAVCRRGGGDQPGVHNGIFRGRRRPCGRDRWRCRAPRGGCGGGGGWVRAPAGRGGGRRGRRRRPPAAGRPMPPPSPRAALRPSRLPLTPYFLPVVHLPLRARRPSLGDPPRSSATSLPRSPASLSPSTPPVTLSAATAGCLFHRPPPVFLYPPRAPSPPSTLSTGARYASLIPPFAAPSSLLSLFPPSSWRPCRRSSLP